MFNSDNIPFLGSNLDDRTVTPLGDDSQSATSTNHLRPALDLNRELIKSPASTFFVRLRDHSTEAEGDLLIVDKSINPHDGCLVVAFMDGEFILKRVKIEDNTTWLIPANSSCQPTRIESNNEDTVWGVVRYLIKKM